MQKTKHYILGASGVIGQVFYKMLKKNCIPVVGTYFRHQFDSLVYFDITKNSLNEMFNITQNDVIYILSSQINPDYIFYNPKETGLINVDSIKKIIDEISKIGAKIIYFSTELIFDGKKGGYKENDVPNPTTLYGKQKLEIESYLMKYSNNYLIIRTGAIVPWVIGLNCPVEKTYKSLMQNNPNIIQNNTMTITDVNDLVTVVITLEKLQVANNIFHVVSSCIDRSQIADEIIVSSKKPLNKYKLVDMDKIEYPEQRPLYSWLDNTKVLSLLNYEFVNPRNIIKRKVKLLERYL